MSAFKQDTGYALRTLSRQPGFSTLVIATLALGIGVNVAIFALVHAVLWKPLPFARPGELAFVHMLRSDPRTPGTSVQTRWSYPKYQTFMANQSVFESAAVVLEGEWTLTGSGSPIRVTGEFVDAGYFNVLGIAPIAGRVFSRSETAEPDSPPLAMIGEGLWSRRFGRDWGAVGRNIDLGDVPHTIVGILPQSFRGLSGLSEVWVPVTTQPARIVNAPLRHSYRLVARRRATVSPETAQAATAVAAAVVDRSFPASPMAGSWSATAIGLDDERVDPLVRRAAQLILAAVAAVMLIVCVNLANLMFVRGLGRLHETAIRVALGASRVRIGTQFMVESLLLAAAGVLGGLVIAKAFMASAAALMPDLQMVLRGPTAGLTHVGLGMVGFDQTTVLFALLTAGVAAVLIGFLPAWRASAQNAGTILKEAAAGVTAGSGRGLTPRNVVMAGQLALALTLLVAAALMLKSTMRLLSTELGVRPEALVTFRLAFPSPSYDPARATQTIEQLVERLASRGDVEAVGYGNCVPVSGGCTATTAVFPDRPSRSGGHASDTVGVYWASPSYFETLGIPLVQGRLFNDSDRSDRPGVAIVGATAARSFWPDENPVGKRIALGQREVSDSLEIIGVVADVKYLAIERTAIPDVYLPILQSPLMDGFIFVRSAASLETLVPAIRSEFAAIDPNLPIIDLKTMGDRLGDATWRTRMGAWLLGAFATLALLLGAIGVYSVVAQGVEQRWREIGVRMALGAASGHITRLVLGRALWIGSRGAVWGLVLAVSSTQLLSSLLYEVTPLDPIVLGSITVVLLGVTFLASYVPARRAVRIDPLTALRAE